MTMQNPLDLLNRFTPSGQDFIDARAENQKIVQDEAMNPLLLQQQQMSNQNDQEIVRQNQINTRNLETQENISNTVNRLQEIERQIGFGATPQQLEQTLQGFILDSKSRGGNPIDSMQALQALQSGGIQGLSSLVGQAKKVFEQQGLIAREGLSEERKLDILGRQNLELEKLKGEQKITLERLKNEINSQDDKNKKADALRSEVVHLGNRLFFDDTRASYGRIIASNDGTPAGDIALIFNYMKLLDPGSAILKDEYASAANATGVPERVVNLYNRLLTGERLNESQRRNFTQQAEKIYSQSESNFKRSIEPILNIGKSRGLTQDNILGEGYFDTLKPKKTTAGEIASNIDGVVSKNTYVSSGGIQYVVE